MMPTRVLVVDDDPAFRRLCSVALEEDGIEHESVRSSQEALHALGSARRPFDLMLLDVELPGMKGWELLRHLRERGQEIPVVLVSILEGLDEKVRAMDLGADDYVVKPCAFDELLSRIHAVIRRIRRTSPLLVGDLEIDGLLRRVRLQGRLLDLTPREFELLQMLARANGAIVSQADFLEHVWELDAEPSTNFLQVHVSRLRRKLRKARYVRIETVPGRGYRLIALPPDSPVERGARDSR